MCGANYVRKNAPVGKRERIKVWICHTFDELGKANCPSQRIREDILIEKTRAVLNLQGRQELTKEEVVEGIKHIEVPEHNLLRYHLTDGRIETVSWENPSRSKSWTPEMRERARQKSLEQHRKRKEKEE